MGPRRKVPVEINKRIHCTKGWQWVGLGWQWAGLGWQWAGLAKPKPDLVRAFFEKPKPDQFITCIRLNPLRLNMFGVSHASTHCNQMI